MPKTAKASYLKAIWALQANGVTATTGALARLLSVSPASASEMIKKLDGVGLARRRPYRPVELTERGERIAAQMVRKHRVIELFLHRVLGMGWDEVHAEAAQWEQTVSDRALGRMDALLGHPSADVHGHPIPLQDGTVVKPDDVQLSEAPVGPLLVSQVSDADSALLRRVEELGLRPGQRLSLVGRGLEKGFLECRIRGEVQLVESAVAAAVRVAVEEGAADTEGVESCSQQAVTSM